MRTCACTTREPCLALTVGGLGLVLLMMCSSWRQELTMDPMRLWNAAGSTAVERERFVERTFGRQRLEQLIARPSSAEPGAIVGAAELRDLFALDRQVHALTATVAPADLPAARAASWTGLYTVDAAAACPAGCCCVQGDFELLDAGADAVLFGEAAGGQGVPVGLRRAVSVRADVGNPVVGACPGAVHQKDFVPSVHSSAAARGSADGIGAALALSIFNQSTSFTRVDADTLRVELHANATAAAGSGGGGGSGAARCPALLARRRLDFRLEDLCFRVGVGGSPLGCLQFHPLAMWALDTTHAVSNPTPGQYFEAALDADVAADGEGTVQDKLLHWDGWADLFNGGLQPLLTNPWTANSTTLAYNGSANAAFAKERVWRAPRGTPANVTALQVWWFLDDSDARRALYPPGVWRQALSSWEGAFAGLVPAGAPRLEVLASAEKSYGDDIGAGILADLPALGAAMGLTLLAAALLAARAGAARDAPGAAGERGGGTAAVVVRVHASSGAVVGGGGALLVLAAALGAFGLCTAVSALPAAAAGGGGGAHEETADDGSGMATPTGRPRALPNSPFSMYALLLLVALGAWQLLFVSELFARAAAAQLAALLSAAATAKAKAGQHPSAAPPPDGEEGGGGGGGGGGGTASARRVKRSSSSSSSSAAESIAAELYARGSAAVYCTAIYAMACIMHNLPCMQGWVVATLGAAAWAAAARAERLARAAAAAGMRAPCSPSPFVRWPRLALGAARAATGGTAAAFCAYLAVGAAQRQPLTGSSVWLGCVSNFIACAWSARCVALARRQQERSRHGGGGGGGGGSAGCCGEELGGHGGVEPQGHWHAGPDGGGAPPLPPLPPAARACLALDAAVPPALPAFDWHPALDRVAAQRALAAAEPVLLGAAVAALLLLLTAAAASSLPAVRAFCAMAAAGVAVLHGTMVWVLPALLQLRWQQLKRQLWWLEPRLRRGGAAAGRSGGGSGGGSRWAQRALPALLLSLLVMLALCARALAQTQLRQRFGREDVLPASSTLHRFFAAQEALFEAVLPMALVSRGLDYGREAAFGPLTAAHASLSACGAVDLSQGAGGVVDWYSQPGGPSPADPGSAVQPDLASQTPLMTYLLSNRSSFGGGVNRVPMHSFCAQWNSFLCPAADDDDGAPPPFPACPGACALGVANITGAVGTPAVPTDVGAAGDVWPRASVVKLWAVSEPDFFGQAFAQDLAFANASAASTLALVCGPEVDPVTQQPVPCQHGDDSLRAGALRAAKSSLFSRALADARDMEEQRAVRDAVQRAVAPAADALHGGSALAGDDGSSAAGAADPALLDPALLDPALSGDDPLFVHSLLFVVLEQFDALREQAKLNLLLGGAAVALAPALAALLARRGRARGGRGEEGKRRAAAAGAATSVSRSVLLPLAVAGASLAAGAASGADLLGLMAPACFSIAISSTSANIVLFLPVLLCFLAAAACAEAAAAAGDGGGGAEAAWRWSPASPTSPTSAATAALRTTLAAVLGGALPCLALASPANQQVATMYVLAAVLAVLHSAALGGAVRLLSRRVSGRPSTLGAVVHSSCAPLLAFE